MPVHKLVNWLIERVVACLHFFPILCWLFNARITSTRFINSITSRKSANYSVTYVSLWYKVCTVPLQSFQITTRVAFPQFRH